jgi:release factor glutamine methyltransferase
LTDCETRGPLGRRFNDFKAKEVSMPETDQWTIGRLLTWTTDYFKQNGIESPRLDAEVLLAEARECERIELYTSFDEPANERTRVTFRELVRRRAEGMPVAYLVGRREFYAMTFFVTPDVLIPRPETEFVLIALLDLAKQRESHESPLRIADVGTGSGILAVCAAKHIPNSTVTAIDVSTSALAVARRNADHHQVADRIHLVEGDLLADLPRTGKFDFIVSNPPYVSEAEFEKLSPEVKRYEPRDALVAGPRGTEVIERLLPQAAEHLESGGWFIFEISPMIAESVRSLIDNGKDWQSVTLHKDLAGHERVVTAQKGLR